MVLRELQTAGEAKDPFVGERARGSSRSHYTHQFAVEEDGCDVAFVSLDIEDCDYLVLYELAVPHTLRRTGVGTRVLLEIERFALSLGYKRIVLNARPLSEDVTQSGLVDWYRKRGFVETPDGPAEMAKIITLAEQDADRDVRG